MMAGGGVRLDVVGRGTGVVLQGSSLVLDWFRAGKGEVRSLEVRWYGGGLGRLVGFEPTTSAATERRSATEL